MMEYEVIREIFNSCSGNQMRDVSVTEVKIDDPDKYMDQFRVGSDIQEDKTIKEDGTIIYDIVVNGLKQRFSFTKI